MNTFQNILVETNENTATITINRPPVNILNIDTMLEVTAAIEDLNRQKALKSIIITGAGEKAFSAGVDVQDHTRKWMTRMIESFDGMLKNVITCDKPVLAAINGLALGGGMELVLACDLAVAVETARLGQPEIKLGVFAGYANAVLPQLIARKKAMEILLMGETISAAEAQSIGLINWVVSANELAATVEELTKKLNELSAVALKWCKRSIYAGLLKDLDENVAVVDKIYLDDLMSTVDANEGIKAFSEKRRPVWQNA